MTALWALEGDIRGKTPEDRSAARRQTSASVIADLFALWEKELPRLSGKSKLAEAIRYAIARRTILERFLHDGRIEIDSNVVERAIRPQAIVRKNALFAGSDGGGRTWSTIATMLTTSLCRARHKQVYADRRTMPINQPFANVSGTIAVVLSA